MMAMKATLVDTPQPVDSQLQQMMPSMLNYMQDQDRSVLVGRVACLSVCLSVCLFVCLPAGMPLCLPHCLSVHLSVVCLSLEGSRYSSTFCQV